MPARGRKRGKKKREPRKWLKKNWQGEGDISTGEKVGEATGTQKSRGSKKNLGKVHTLSDKSEGGLRLGGGRKR